MKAPALCAALALALPLLSAPQLSAGPLFTTTPEAQVVTVWGRNWTVAPDANKPGFWRATRDWNNLDPFGQPARLRTAQAMQAFHAATGCKAIYSSMYQTITGDVLSELDCPLTE
ncbi:hypothetical protein [Pseudodonghicola xiamenensis]|uniref:Uncharacterized protein n=1 Tax=Pseudodonghicola xiamenensis TaxID=337702 RepID=A0A8J3H6Q1_9RHOB|nr:hypothetical protein [Pseudodonghicola xiamenensis]GHG93561.1 hypothetical protein GCM10010961_26120 [Pseudodonghicola xiamenensis]